jgi:hypothetical protein
MIDNKAPLPPDDLRDAWMRGFRAGLRLCKSRTQKIINILNTRDPGEGCGAVSLEEKLSAIRAVLIEIEEQY